MSETIFEVYDTEGLEKERFKQYDKSQIASYEDFQRFIYNVFLSIWL